MHNFLTLANFKRWQRCGLTSVRYAQRRHNSCQDTRRQILKYNRDSAPPLYVGNKKGFVFFFFFGMYKLNFKLVQFCGFREK